MLKENEKLFKKWLHQEEGKLKKQPVNRKEESRAKRTYIHFDKRRHSSSLLGYKKFLLNPKTIAQISCWPFIKIDLKTPRYKKNKNNNKRKKEIKKRSVYYASHQDALIYSWYSYLLNEKYYNNNLKKLGIEKCVYAYRKIPIKKDGPSNKCNIHFAKEIFDYISSNNNCVAFVADITGFFDNLDHEHLKKEWCNLLDINASKLPNDHYAIFKNLTKFKYVEADKLYDALNLKNIKKTDYKSKKTYQVLVRNNTEVENICSRKEFVEKVVRNNLIKGNERTNTIKDSKRNGQKCGIMQGSPISATLSNIYMTSFDIEINELVKNRGGLYRRYSDDIITVCNQKDFKMIKSAVLNSIKKYELEINPSKTDTTYFLKDQKDRLRGYQSNSGLSSQYKNLQYLGFEFNGQKVFIRSSSVAKYYRKMKAKSKKAVDMALGKKSKTKKSENKIFKKTLFKKYLYNGRRSFISYALRANEIMRSESIRKQLSGRFNIIKKTIDYRIKRKEIKATNKKPPTPNQF